MKHRPPQPPPKTPPLASPQQGPRMDLAKQQLGATIGQQAVMISDLMAQVDMLQRDNAAKDLKIAQMEGSKKKGAAPVKNGSAQPPAMPEAEGGKPEIEPV